MKTIFLDRDGVINENPPNRGYVCRWDDFSFLPNALHAINILTKNDFRIFLVTNQAGIGKGIFTEKQLADIHQRMLTEINRYGGDIGKIYHCPHHPDDRCLCRKPKPGMLIAAADEHGLDITKTFFIGDSITDMEAARGAGTSPILVLTGHGRETYNNYYKSSSNDKTEAPDRIFTNLYTASRWLIRLKKTSK